MAEHGVGFISLFGPDSLPDTIPKQVRADMVGVPLPFRFNQRDLNGLDWFDTSELFANPTENPLYVNSLMAAVALRAFGNQESEEYWLQLTAKLSADHNIKKAPSHLKLRTVADVRREVDKASEEIFPIYGTGRPMTGKQLEGGLPIPKDAGVVRTAPEQLDKFIELGQPVFGFQYVNHFAGDAGTNAFLEAYAEKQGKNGTINEAFWRILGAASVKNERIAAFISPARHLGSRIPEEITEILYDAGMTGERFSIR